MLNSLSPKMTQLCRRSGCTLLQETPEGNVCGLEVRREQLLSNAGRRTDRFAAGQELLAELMARNELAEQIPPTCSKEYKPLR